MSSDSNDPLGGLDDLDWESALDEWEQKSFSSDAEANAAEAAPISEAAPSTEAAPTVASAPPSDPALRASPAGTLIAQVPRELRDEPLTVVGPPAPETAVAPPTPAYAWSPSSLPTRASAPSESSIPAPAPRPSTRASAPSIPSPPRASAPSIPSPAPRPSARASSPSVPSPTRASSPSIPSRSSMPSPLSGPPRVSSGPPSRGGLGQLFSRPPRGATPSAAPEAPTLATAPPVEGRASAFPSVESPTRKHDGEQLLGALLDLPPSLPPPEPARGTFEPTSAPVAAPRALAPDVDDDEGEGETLVKGRPRTSDDAAPAPQVDEVTSRWLAGDKARAFAARVAWLEEEARALDEAGAQARALLAVSELCALRGDSGRAHELAVEARELAPGLALAWVQARQLMPRDPDALTEALDAEATRAPTASARAHAALLAADVLRRSGQGDAAVERWEHASKLDPADPRGPVARAAVALAQDDHTSPSLRLAENSELLPFGRAVATALRLRDVEHPGTAVFDVRINDGLRHTRRALEAGDPVAAAQAIGELASVPELSKAALWLSAALGATTLASRRQAVRSLGTLVGEGDDLARRPLAARGLELSDPELVQRAIADGPTAFEPAERAVLGALAGAPVAGLDALANDEPMAALVDALSALATPGEHDGTRRATQVSGTDDARPLAYVGRLLAMGAPDGELDEALATTRETRTPSAEGVALERASRGARWTELGDTLSRLPGASAQRHLAAAIVAERARSRERAREAWTEAARHDDVATDGILRIASELAPELDLATELLRVADGMPDGVPSSILRIEALARTPGLGDDEEAAVLDRVHRGAPTIGVGAFLAERAARRRDDDDEALRWLHDRRTLATDPVEAALDAVREANLLAPRDRELAAARLEEAHRACPDDVALRELYERVAPEPPSDSGAWREARASRASGRGAAFLWLGAALEHERTGDAPATLRAARAAAEAGDDALSRLMLERAEIETGDITGRAGELVERTRTAQDEQDRRDALERLAELDLVGRKDGASARLWHRAILEETPLHTPSLRWLEHALIGEGRDDELAAIFEHVAIALDGTRGGEVAAHAQHAARLQRGDGGITASWERTHDMARLAATQPEPSLWSLRALHAHARVHGDDEAVLDTTLALIERTQRAPERAALLLRASDAAGRLGRADEARAHLEQAANEDPGDVVTWGLLADVRQRAGDARGAAEACEGLARTSAVHDHQLLAWHDASRLWLEEIRDVERGMGALEAAAEIDVTYADVFPRLSALYAERGLDAELARLQERRLERVEDEDERVALEVELSRTLVEMGDLASAKARLSDALYRRPDHTTALGAMADLCAREGDWAGTEQALVRLARLLSQPEEQRAIYERLGEIYSVQSPNLSRAEVAFREVLKRSPGDPKVLARLVDVYRRQGDVQRAVEVQQELVGAESDPDARLSGLIELAKIYEEIGHDARRSEQVLESARKEFPTSVVALRALAEFYARHRQMPAMHILLDRAAGDARRAFAQGRFVPSLFQVLHAAFELRGKHDAARVVAATLAAVEGEPASLHGGEAGALDPRLDDLLAPELVSAALRTLLFRVGDGLDAATPVDRAALRTSPLQPGTPLAATVGSIATFVGLGAMQVLVSPALGRTAIPVSTSPPVLLVGEALARSANEPARMFVVARAMKMMLVRSSALLRTPIDEVDGLLAGLFHAFNPTYVPQGMDPKRVVELSRRIGPALPRNVDPTIGVIALEAAGMVGDQWANLGHAIHSWASRAALLAVGDPNAALDGIAWGRGEDAAPTGSEERAAWIARHREARELMTFSVTDAYAEARGQLGLIAS